MKSMRLSVVLTICVLMLAVFGSGAVVHADGACALYSPFGCDTIKVELLPQVCLPFNNGAGGLPDKVGNGTGFTMVDPASSQLSDQPSGHASAPSYVSDLLQVKNGQLQVIATKGINFNTPGGTSNAYNSLTNGLGLGFSGSGKTEISVELVNLDFLSTPSSFQSQQAGLWFGTDEDNYVKLIIYKTEFDTGRIQLLAENKTGATVTVQDHKPVTDFIGLPNSTVKLTMTIDSSNNSVTGSYSINGDAPVSVGKTFTVPASFFSGKNLPDTTGPMTFAGIMATKRTAPEIEKLVVTFDNFCITRVSNIAPQAAPDTYNVTEDSALNVNVANGVLANDIDPNPNTTLTAAIVDNPQHSAAFTLNANGSFSYTPAANFAGSDTFTYKAGDGTDFSPPTTVTITVSPVNDAPVAQNADYAMAEDGVLSVKVAAGLMMHVADPDGDTLTLTLVGQPLNGTLAFNPSGSFTYTPMPNFFGADTFTYKASDGTLESNTATVTINVNGLPDMPDAVDDHYTAIEETDLVVGAGNGVLANDSNPDGGETALEITDQPDHGTLTLNADGSFTYSPASAYLGTDSFGYSLTTPSGSDSATVSITVAPEPVELIANGDFEAVTGGAKAPDDWVAKRLGADTVVCNQPNAVKNGACAFYFRGEPNESSLLEQKLELNGIGAGDKIVLSAFVRGKKVVQNAGKITVRLSFDDGSKKNYTIVVPRGNYDYRRYQKTMMIDKTVTAARVRIVYTGAKGKWWVDGVSMQFIRGAGTPLAFKPSASVSTSPVNDLRGSN